MSRLFEALQRAEIAAKPDAVAIATDETDDPAERAFESEFTRETGAIPSVDRIVRADAESIPIAEHRTIAAEIVAPELSGRSAPADVVSASRSLCPYCAAPCDVRLSAWTRTWSRLRRQGEYHCRACGRRFRRPRTRTDASVAAEPRAIPGFLPADDQRSFQELIRDLRRDEGQLHARPDSRRERTSLKRKRP